MSQSSRTQLKETFLVSGFASLLILITSWPAFKYFFFAEAFTYLRLYNLNGKHLWLSAFRIQDGMFFRPVFLITQVLWNLVLPPDPLVYHVRNFAFCAINIFLFHRILLRFAQSRWARIIGVGLFAASKMHLTIIGYMSVYESTVFLGTILLTVLFWFRYIEKRRPLDYALALLFSVLCAYGKDNGGAVIAILAAMILVFAIKPGAVKSKAYYWAVRYAPFVVVSLSALIVRFVLTGPINPNHPIYSPRLSLGVTAWQTKAFLATVGNFSLTNPGFMGERGFSAVLLNDSSTVEIVLCVALWLLILFTLWRGRSSWRLLVVPLLFIALYLFPTLLIRNHQVYYYQEPLIGLAIMVAICLDRAPRPLLTTWLVVVGLIAVNGFISNRRSSYYWQITANRAEGVVKPVVASLKGNPPKELTFVTSPQLRDFWVFTVGGPLIPQLLGSPDMRVKVVDSANQAGSDSAVYYLPEL